MNAKNEFLRYIFEMSQTVRCAVVNDFTLSQHASYSEYERFLEDIDFNYDEGYGTQELFGTIWHKDGTWSTRDANEGGAERWVHHSCPEILEGL